MYKVQPDVTNVLIFTANTSKILYHTESFSLFWALFKIIVKFKFEAWDFSLLLFIFFFYYLHCIIFDYLHFPEVANR